MHRKLPKVLNREPLVDALFEMRFKGAQLLADILPGFLFAELNPKPVLLRLPAAEIPRPMRANDPNLQFIPVQRLEWENFFISIGDQNVVISCKLPYPKWPSFKNAILKIVNHIAKADIDGQIERYSLKYVNLIQAQTFTEQIQKIRMKIQLGEDDVKNDHMSLQVHRNAGNVVHILSVMIGAQMQFPNGKQVLGAIVDIDSINTIDAPNFTSFVENLDEGIEKLRQDNKRHFFSCLTEDTITEMEPDYE